MTGLAATSTIRRRKRRARFAWTDGRLEILRSMADSHTAAEIAQRLRAPDTRAVYRAAAFYGIPLGPNTRGGPSLRLDLTAKEARALDAGARARGIDRAELARRILVAVASGNLIDAVLDDR